MTLVLQGIDGIRDHEGRELGVGPYTVITQASVDDYRSASGLGDADSPVVPPFYLLSVVPLLWTPLFRVEGVSAAVNYGLDEVRFGVPPKAGDEIRATVALTSVVPVGSGVQAVFATDVWVRGRDEPASVSRVLIRYAA